MTIYVLDSMKVVVLSRRKTLRDPRLGINEYIITTVNVHAMRPVRLLLYLFVLTRRMDGTHESLRLNSHCRLDTPCQVVWYISVRSTSATFC